MFCISVKCTGQKKEDLVMVHGFAEGSASYYRMFKYLAQSYDIYAIDNLGMGESSRPTARRGTQEDYISFFIDPINQCVEHLKLDKFTLVGHSYGGLFACYYT